MKVWVIRNQHGNILKICNSYKVAKRFMEDNIIKLLGGHLICDTEDLIYVEVCNRPFTAEKYEVLTE